MGSKNFQRADVALISWEALFAEKKDGTVLGDILMAEGLFAERDFWYARDVVDGYDFEIILGVRIGRYIRDEDGGGYEYDS